ncbi:MAG: hypothetical protein HYV35_12410 [Lentisphaerae bacterium]|nr:hypothetical protein [Lentisphaerota bacterium]
MNWTQGLLFAVLSSLAAGLAWAEDEKPLSNDVVVTAQWRADVASGAGFVTMDLFLTHTGSLPVIFRRLSGVDSNGAPDAAMETNVVWKRFYPTTAVEPGGTILAQWNFRRAPRAPQWVCLEAEGYAPLRVALPPYREGGPRLEAIVFSGDGRQAYVQYRYGRAPPTAVLVNGREVIFRTRRADGMTAPDLAACDLPEPLTTGAKAHVRMRFKDGTTAHGLVRVWRGLLLDAYLCNRPEDRRALGLDAEPGVIFPRAAFQGDVACFDVRQGTNGAAAVAVEAERPALLAGQPDKLLGIHYCTSMSSGFWNLYGALADVAMASPYRLTHAADVRRFLDDEIALMERARLSVRPGYWMWIPDVFQRRARFMEPEELRVLTWTALAKGCKGLKYFAWHLDDPKQFGFDRNPALTEAIKAQNVVLRRWADRLAPLVAVREETHGDARAGYVQYTAWSGERGVLTVVRNLKYVTDGQANAEGAPRFRVYPKTNVTVKVRVPGWLKSVRVEDLLTGEPLPETPTPGGVEVRLPRLAAVCVLWAAPGGASPAAEAPAGRAPTNVATDVLPLSGEPSLLTAAGWQWVQISLLALVLVGFTVWVVRRRRRSRL